MTQQQSKRQARRGRIFPELTISPEKRVKKEAEDQIFDERCRLIFERVRPELIKDHYNWFIIIEPDSEDYFIAQDSMAALQIALEKHPQALFFTFRLNETGVAGRV
ncbi:hypothetical protein [Coleofasciculus sp. H7-2]|uniref:hypothetical protein n=1 Tax=Coleofasciculus sp. H7-2 TaxID=3351545 RepID=UPI00366F17D4